MTMEVHGHAHRDDQAHVAARALQELRQAEALLSRRRQASQQRSATDRAAIRFIVEQSWEGRNISPTDLAHHLGVSSAAVTGLIDRLETANLVALRTNPADRRKKIIEPLNPADDPNVTDGLSARIREISGGLSPDEQELVASYLERITAAIRDESER